MLSHHFQHYDVHIYVQVLVARQKDAGEGFMRCIPATTCCIDFRVNIAQRFKSPAGQERWVTFAFACTGSGLISMPRLLTISESYSQLQPDLHQQHRRTVQFSSDGVVSVIQPGAWPASHGQR